MKLRLAQVVEDSIVDGPGLRLAVFVQGCGHHCPGCHNPGSHDPLGGYQGDTDDLLPLLDNPMLGGVTLTGGEPFEQPQPLALLAREAQARGLTVWTYTGFVLEQLLASPDPHVAQLLTHTDVLVDGPFVLARRSLALTFRGSDNQRMIDLPATLAGRTVVLLEE